MQWGLLRHLPRSLSKFSRLFSNGSGSHLEFQRLTNHLGAQVSTDDFETSWSHGEFYNLSSTLKQLLAEHKVLVLNTSIRESEDFAKLSSLVGPVRPVKNEGDQNYKYVQYYKTTGRKGSESNRASDFWHSDNSYLEQPARATMLLAISVPEEGGDTLFCDMVAAWEALDPALKAKLKKNEGLHTFRYNPGAPTQRVQRAGFSTEKNVWHPSVIKTATGRSAVYVSPAYTKQLSRESEVLEEVYSHCYGDNDNSPFIYRHKWTNGDVVIWDNQQVCHKGTTVDMETEKIRIMMRASIKGEEPQAGA